MLANANATPMIAVEELDRARRFYTDVLGAREVGSVGEEVVNLQTGDTRFDIYRSQYAGTNKATALTFSVDDVEAEAAELKGKGIAFEHYDMDGLERQGDVYVAEGMKTAWFKDPDGNILSLIEG
ncbi:VOC family protein [Sphingomonas glaciei]|uniref:VOC family protein n=1 Tax=Sphingomonas glaciei TaxID=2938948 RepID=A0ABY5MV06_9SPHN|nr:VOC family protein [Sphingomonas glaciei]UUR07806.1 VOC family protein [Sphingomonas glaciei]